MKTGFLLLEIIFVIPNKVLDTTNNQMSGSVLLIRCLAQVRHYSTMSWICLLRPGHLTACFALSLYFMIPWCH